MRADGQAGQRLTLTTPELRAGDIVVTHGMRVRLDTLVTYPSGHGQTVYAWHGTVTNPEDVRREDLVPLSWWRDGWTVQGNDLARWSVERRVWVWCPSAMAPSTADLDADDVATCRDCGATDHDRQAADGTFPEVTP
jgi:hypothetical protein